jgi:hypothetical protein
MDFLQFADVSFQPDTNIGRLCEILNNTVGNAIWCDAFAIRNKKWFLLVNNIVAVMNNNILCGCFGIYPRLAGGILDPVNDTDFYVLCNKKLNYADYIEKCISGRKRTIS